MRKSLRSGLVLCIGLLAAIGRSEGRAQAAAGITIQKDVMVGAKHCDQVSWTDANGKARSVWLVRGDGHTVGLTIDWVISQGRNDVLWAVSYDAMGQGSFDWDARGPYFQFDWDGDGHFYDAAISGIKWGDKYRFRTTTYSGATSDWD